MNGLITYGFGKIYNQGLIIVYGMLKKKTVPFKVVYFDLFIQRSKNLNLLQ